MLFYITEDVAHKANIDKDVLDALVSLGYFWRIGHCLIDGSRSCLESLAAVDALRADYELILRQKQNVIGLYKEIDFFIVLSINNVNSVKSIERAQGKPISIYDFKNRIKFGLNVVLCENIIDFEFYLWGTNIFSKIDQNIFRINVFGYNGGGDTTVVSAKHVKDYPCLIICDCDKKYPEDKNEGRTCKELESYYKAERPLMTWLYRLDVQEVENLIPCCILAKMYGMKGLAKKMLSLKNNSNYGTFFGYFDFKEGFQKSTLRKMKKENVGSYTSCVDMLNLLSVSQKTIDNSLKQKYKKGEKPLLPGIGKDILKDAVNYVLNNNVDKIDIDKHQINDWTNIIRKMWSIGCANNPRRL